MSKIRKKFYKYCVVPMCKNTVRNAPEKVYFYVPQDANLRKKWCKAMRRDDVSPTSCLYCCEDHFSLEEDTANYMQYKIMALQEGQKMTLRLKKGVIPHIFQCQKNNKRTCGSKRKRLALLEEPQSECVIKQEVDTSETPMDITDTKIKIDCESDPSILSSNGQIDEDFQFKSELHCNKADNNIALAPFPISCIKISSAIKVRSTIKRKLFLENVVNYVTQSMVISTNGSDGTSSESSRLEEDNLDSDKQFNYQMRCAMLRAIEREPKLLLGLPKKSYYLIKLLSENTPLPTIYILITLKKIKLNESFCILALHFGYAQDTITRIFSKSIRTIAERLKELIVWPAPSKIFENLPLSFKAEYDNVVSIIDCLELQIENPSNKPLVHQSLTWSSQCNKCNILKYLISYTPDGFVTYVSNGYGSKATDLMIVEDCGFLDYLPCNKAVMTDTRFKDASCLLENKNCILVQPPSLPISPPSTKEDVKQSIQITALRIHLEHVLSRLREFHMLLPHARIDHNLISVTNDIIVVACGLINIQNVFIKKYYL